MLGTLPRAQCAYSACASAFVGPCRHRPIDASVGPMARLPSALITLLALSPPVTCRKGKGRGARRRAELVEAARQAELGEAAAAAANGEVIDPLGYYRYRWTPPTDACGTELHADYDGTRAWYAQRLQPWTAQRRLHSCLRASVRAGTGAWTSPSTLPLLLIAAPSAVRIAGATRGSSAPSRCASRPTRTSTPLASAG